MSLNKSPMYVQALVIFNTSYTELKLVITSLLAEFVQTFPEAFDFTTIEAF